MIRIENPLGPLLLGSPLVLLGVAGWAAMDWAMQAAVTPPRQSQSMPVYRFVDADSGQPNASVWATSTARDDCHAILDLRERQEKQRIADLISTGEFSGQREDANVCAPFQLGEIEANTKLELLDEYGPIARVRILSGSLAGRQGYVENVRLRGSAG